MKKKTRTNIKNNRTKTKITRMTNMKKKSRNGDTLGPVELNVRLEQSNQGDRCEQDDQGEVSIIIFGMSESSGFQKYSISWVFQALFSLKPLSISTKYNQPIYYEDAPVSCRLCLMMGGGVLIKICSKAVRSHLHF